MTRSSIPPRLTPGKYRLIFLIGSGNYRYYEYETYTHIVGEVEHLGRLCYETSGRPVSGTGHIPVRNVLQLEKVDERVKPRGPRKLNPNERRYPKGISEKEWDHT